MFLFDANFLIALGDADHVHHDEAQTFFTLKKQDGWATCPLTENAFLRILGHPNYPKGPSSSTRENFQHYPVQKISQTTTYSLSRSKIEENSSLSTKESTQVYWKAAFPPIMLLNPNPAIELKLLP